MELSLQKKKIRKLAENLGFCKIQTARLETIVHEICRFGCRNGKEMYIEIALSEKDSKPILALNFQSTERIETIKAIPLFFDDFRIEKEKAFVFFYSSFKYLPDSYIFSPQFVEKQKVMISNPSREELMATLKRKNDELEERALELGKAKPSCHS